MQPVVPETWAVPDAWRTAAEEVRQHLCALRGGALFLSSADTLRLVGWLEQGVTVADIARALERASAARRKTASRIPLSLTQAQRHLGKPTRGAFTQTVPAADEPVFGPVVTALRAHPEQTAHLRELQRALAQIESAGEGGVVEALAAVRAYHEAAWNSLPPAEQARFARRRTREPWRPREVRRRRHGGRAGRRGRANSSA